MSKIFILIQIIIFWMIMFQFWNKGTGVIWVFSSIQKRFYFQSTSHTFFFVNTSSHLPHEDKWKMLIMKMAYLSLPSTRSTHDRRRIVCLIHAKKRIFVWWIDRRTQWKIEDRFIHSIHCGCVDMEGEISLRGRESAGER